MSSPNSFAEGVENVLIDAFELSWSLSSVVLLPNREKGPDEPAPEPKKEVELDEPVLKKLGGLTLVSCDEVKLNGFGLDADESLDEVLKENTDLGASGATEESDGVVSAFGGAADVEIGSESVVAEAEKLKADVLDPLVPNLRGKPPPDVVDDDDDNGGAKPAKLVGGAGMLVDVLVVLCIG